MLVGLYHTARYLILSQKMQSLCLKSNYFLQYSIETHCAVLKETEKLGLRFGLIRDHEDGGLIEFTDSFYGDKLNTGQSTSDYIFFL